MTSPIGDCPKCGRKDVKISPAGVCHHCLGAMGTGNRDPKPKKVQHVPRANPEGTGAEVKEERPVSVPENVSPERRPEPIPSNTPPERGREVYTDASETTYLCDMCGSPVQYGSRKCRKCGGWNDWRRTPVETDDEYVICPNCGAMCGFADSEISACPHCGFSPEE